MGMLIKAIIITTVVTYFLIDILQAHIGM